MSHYLDYILQPREVGEGDMNSIMDFQDMDGIEIENNDLMVSYLIRFNF